jgi:hypothetical protein
LCSSPLFSKEVRCCWIVRFRRGFVRCRIKIVPEMCCPVRFVLAWKIYERMMVFCRKLLNHNTIRMCYFPDIGNGSVRRIFFEYFPVDFLV